ncbi:MAG: HvfC/BufC family peptide modification chaperone [Steroidobacteraceae bacterium]
MRSLRDLQAAFAAALHGAPSAAAPGILADGLDREARLQVYRHNTEAIFEGTLARTYPVLRRRVGDEHFRQLARLFRLQHFSRSGDLHWIGRDFASFLARYHESTPYAWLAHLARLEWACEEALVAADAAPLTIRSLAHVAPGRLADVRLTLQPSTRIVSSPYPVFTVWAANQESAAAPVDLTLGAEHVVLRCARNGLRLYGRTSADAQFVEQLLQGAPLGVALETSGLTPESLHRALAWLFAEEFVTGVEA